MSTSISNGRPENKELTRQVEILKKEFAEKRKRAAEERAQPQPAATSH